jgi:hypothetical protein
MRKRARLALLALATATVALLAVASASANATTLNLNPAGSFTATSIGHIALAGTGGFIDITLNCREVLSGTLEATTTATPGTRIGAITAASGTNCDNGTERSLFDDPTEWELTFEGLSLPSQTLQLGLHDYNFSYTVLGYTCLYRGDLRWTVSYTGSGPYTLGNATIQRNNTDLTSGGGFLCPLSGEFTGSYTLSTQTLTIT